MAPENGIDIMELAIKLQVLEERDRHRQDTLGDIEDELKAIHKLCSKQTEEMEKLRRYLIIVGGAIITALGGGTTILTSLLGG